MRVAAALATGLALATVPFLRYAHPGAVEAHADHEPHHGGILGMAGDHHIELRRGRGTIEAFVSDAVRRPVRPRDGWVVVDGRRRIALGWRNHRLQGADVAGASRMDVAVALADGETLSVGFDVAPSRPRD
jgi:hypothetical protein